MARKKSKKTLDDIDSDSQINEKISNADEAYAVFHQHSERYHTFNHYLEQAKDLTNPIKMAKWLHVNLGYTTIPIKHQIKEISLADALKWGYDSNVKNIFEKEVKRLEKEVETSKKYVFPDSK